MAARRTGSAGADRRHDHLSAPACCIHSIVSADAHRVAQPSDNHLLCALSRAVPRLCGTDLTIFCIFLVMDDSRWRYVELSVRKDTVSLPSIFF